MYLIMEIAIDKIISNDNEIIKVVDLTDDVVSEVDVMTLYKYIMENKLEDEFINAEILIDTYKMKRPLEDTLIVATPYPRVGGRQILRGIMMSMRSSYDFICANKKDCELIFTDVDHTMYIMLEHKLYRIPYILKIQGVSDRYFYAKDNDKMRRVTRENYEIPYNKAYYVQEHIFNKKSLNLDKLLDTN